MKLLLSLFIAAITCTLPVSSRADEASHRKAAESLLGLMDMEKLLGDSIDQMLQIQVQQNPTLAQYQPQMKAFLAKYMSWASLKDEMITIYATEFSEAELKEVTAFYQTPVGKKMVQKMPALMAKGAQLGQKRVQDHLPELQAAITGKGAEKP